MRIIWAIIALALLTSQAPAVDSKKVDEALTKAKEYLYAQQKDDNWEEDYDVHGDQKSGATALVCYALLASGESHQETHIAKAIEYLRKTPTTGVYALGMRCQVWLALPPTPENKAAMAKDAKILQTSIRAVEPGRGMYDYNPGNRKTFSHSRAQYGVLGMWAAAQSGVIVPDAYWTMVEKGWIADQDASGGWTYKDKVDSDYPLTAGMTAVGVATLFITQEFLHANDGVPCKGNITNPNIDKGMKWISDNFSKVGADDKSARAYPYATLYAIERIGVASGFKYINNIDWYEKGATWLLSKQQKAGSWPSELGSNTYSTCFTILFLSRGRAPLAMSKLDYSASDPKGNWNQRPRDAANISRWTGRASERDLNWQVISFAGNERDFHDAPILYISGDKEIKFSDEHKGKIKSFIESGGLVLANADCGGKGFVTSIQKIAGEMFPTYQFRELPEQHPIYVEEQFNRSKWRVKPSVLGMSNGARELMILIPQNDFGKSWQLGAAPGRDEPFQLGANVFLYAVDKTHVLKRGETFYIARDEKITPQKSIKVARLQYSGSWDPEPGGWKRLAAVMNNRNVAKLEVTPVKLGDAKLTGISIAHLTGTDAFKLDDTSVAELKTFIDAGNTLIIDAAGGSSAFAEAAEALLASLVPDAKPARLGADHAIFKGAQPLQIAYRNFSRKALGALESSPRIQAIEKNGKLAVIYSREDISAGLVGQYVDGIIGYEPPAATDLMARMLVNLPGPAK